MKKSNRQVETWAVYTGIDPPEPCHVQVARMYTGPAPDKAEPVESSDMIVEREEAMTKGVLREEPTIIAAGTEQRDPFLQEKMSVVADNMRMLVLRRNN